jgi:predicted nucleic acid-binding protein
MEEEVVSDTGPLISLEKMQDGYGFIRKLSSKIIVPPSVLEEVFRGSFSTAEEYLQAFNIQNLIEVQDPPTIPKVFDSNPHLHQPEKEAIALALSLQKTLFIEEDIGRNVGITLGLEISGIAGQVLKAKEKKIIDKEEAVQKFKELFEGGRLNRKLYESLLQNI